MPSVQIGRDDARRKGALMQSKKRTRGAHRTSKGVSKLGSVLGPSGKSAFPNLEEQVVSIGSPGIVEAWMNLFQWWVGGDGVA